jgi:hypothetical protein
MSGMVIITNAVLYLPDGQEIPVTDFKMKFTTSLGREMPLAEAED